jgi:hypothetical protein
LVQEAVVQEVVGMVAVGVVVAAAAVRTCTKVSFGQSFAQ